MILKNKVCIITGSSRGIGFEVAVNYAKEGAKVVVTGFHEEGASQGLTKLKEIVKDAEAISIGMDVNDISSIQKCFKTVYEKYGKIDVLVNNAGISYTNKIEEVTDEDYERVMSTNFGGVVKCTRECLKYMKENGSIINTSSINGVYGSKSQSIYSASKSAIIGFTKSLSKELGHRNIRVNAVAPGVIETDMVKENVKEETKNALINMTPLHRIGKPNDLSGLYVFLASDLSSFITGQIIGVDGGLLM